MVWPVISLKVGSCAVLLSAVELVSVSLYFSGIDGVVGNSFIVEADLGVVIVDEWMRRAELPRGGFEVLDVTVKKQSYNVASSI